MLSIIATLLGVTMIFSLPWAWPVLSRDPSSDKFELYGFLGLLFSLILCFIAGAWLRYIGRNEKGGVLYRKEAMAVVGLSWILATVLGALPFLLSGTCSGEDAAGNKIHMNVADALFESQSGFSTTGATVITNLEDPELVPKCILFWRSSTHFLGGLGIIVLFVAILGQGSAGKALMRAEVPGVSKDGPRERMQHTAWVFAGIYCALTGVLAVLLLFGNMSVFDALCHAFGTLATGGFSTYNDSVAHFELTPGYNFLLIESVIILFMVIAGTNFTLLYFVCLRRPGKLMGDLEWRTYMAIILGVTVLVVTFGLHNDDFRKPEHESWLEEFGASIRYGLFQVVAIITTTGFGTHNFDNWSSFGRGALFLLMFVGGCAGSTGGGLKVIRHILFHKVLYLEVEHSFRPNVVRPMRLGGEVIEDPDLRFNILLYFGLILFLFIFSWMLLVTIEPDSTWTEQNQPLSNKLVDVASSVAATLNNIGPGLGIVGAKENYASFSWYSKIVFTMLMMLGRLEIFVILVLFVPRFWRTY